MICHNRAMTLTDCIPTDKFDHEAVERASALGYPGINPILPDLLIWLQDRNWPVAEDVARLLEWADVEIAPPYRRDPEVQRRRLEI